MVRASESAGLGVGRVWGLAAFLQTPGPESIFSLCLLRCTQNSDAVGESSDAVRGEYSRRGTSGVSSVVMPHPPPSLPFPLSEEQVSAV